MLLMNLKSCSLFLSTLLLASTTLVAYEDLREAFAKELHDIKHINKIVKEYNHLMQQVELEPATQERLENWIVRKTIFLGSARYNNDRVFKKIPSLAKNKKFSLAYQQFIKNITPKNRGKNTLYPRTQKNISVL